MIEVSKESEMEPMGTSRKSGDLTWNDPTVVGLLFCGVWYIVST